MEIKWFYYKLIPTREHRLNDRDAYRSLSQLSIFLRLHDIHRRTRPLTVQKPLFDNAVVNRLQKFDPGLCAG